jgi:DNA polymerase (family 10)
LREDQGEIDAAASGRLPELVELQDLAGDLHVHTTATDGRNSLEEMALAARAKGYSYIAITDHSRRMTVTHGLDGAGLRKQCQAIDAFNRTRPGIVVFKGIEVDILADGRLDLPDEVLGELDLVVAAIHSKFDLSRTDQTARLLRAIDNPLVTILAHPSGRLLGEREAYDVDMEQVLREAAARGVFIELNAQPNRLDLLDSHCRMARDLGVLISIDSDAHSVAELDYVRFGVGQARRGWLRPNDVLNTRPLAQLRRLLDRRCRGGRRTLPGADR